MTLMLKHCPVNCLVGHEAKQYIVSGAKVLHNTLLFLTSQDCKSFLEFVRPEVPSTIMASLLHKVSTTH